MVIFILGLASILSTLLANAAIAVADTSSLLSTYIIEVRKPPTDKDLATLEDLDTLYGSFLPTSAASSDQEQEWFTHTEMYYPGSQLN